MIDVPMYLFLFFSAFGVIVLMVLAYAFSQIVVDKSLKNARKRLTLQIAIERELINADERGNYPILRDRQNGQLTSFNPGNSPFPNQFLTITGNPTKFRNEDYTVISENGTPKTLINRRTDETFQKTSLPKSTPKPIQIDLQQDFTDALPSLQSAPTWRELQASNKPVQHEFEPEKPVAQLQAAIPAFVAIDKLDQLRDIYNACGGIETKQLEEISGFTRSGTGKKWKALVAWRDAGCPLPEA